MRRIGLTALAVLCAVNAASGQTPATPTGRGGTAPRARPAAAGASARVIVKDSGGPLPDVKVTLTGVSSGEMTTNGFGAAVFPNLKDGVYRLRFEHEGFVTLEREFTVRGTPPIALEVQLNEAPAPPAPPPPPPAPAPAALPPGGPPVTMSIPNFLDKNLIGSREPLKESIISCSGLETVRLLQLRESLAEHEHADADEVLYVVAGEGAIRIAGEATPISAGSISVVSHGTKHLVERRGRNPLILVSTLSGSPCEATQ